MFFGIRKYNFGYLLISVVLLLCGCNDSEKIGAPMSFRVTGYDRFEQDYRMGLFCGEPVNADNVPFTVSVSGRAMPEKSVNWGYAQTLDVDFMAYGPYDASYSGQESVVIDIPQDQTSVENMKKANILVSYTTGSPQLSSVQFEMKHAMTALMILLENHSASPVESVSVSGMMTNARFDLITGRLTPDLPRKEVKPMQSPSGADVYSLLYFPQDATLRINVKMASGKTIEIIGNDCPGAPGKVINIGPVVITDSVPKELVLSPDYFKTTLWNTNGLPEFPPAPDSKKDSMVNNFVNYSLYGFYDISAADSVTYCFEGADGQLQFSVRRMPNARSQQVVDFKNGVAEYCYVYDCNGNPVVDGEYTIALNYMGNTDLSGSTIKMKCIKVESGIAWLMNEQVTKGLVLGL